MYVFFCCQQLYNEFSRAKTQSQTSLTREKQLRDLAMAFDSFMELKANIEEGIKVCQLGTLVSCSLYVDMQYVMNYVC